MPRSIWRKKRLCMRINPFTGDAFPTNTCNRNRRNTSLVLRRHSFPFISSPKTPNQCVNTNKRILNEHRSPTDSIPRAPPPPSPARVHLPRNQLTGNIWNRPVVSDRCPGALDREAQYPRYRESGRREHE